MRYNNNVIYRTLKFLNRITSSHWKGSKSVLDWLTDVLKLKLKEPDFAYIYSTLALADDIKTETSLKS